MDSGPAVQNRYRHTHSVERTAPRELKRLALTVESHLRIKLGLPFDSSIHCPFPVPAATCKAFLERIAQQPEQDGERADEFESTP